MVRVAIAEVLMRNPIFIFPVGIVFVFLTALVFVYFDLMTMTEFLARTKVFLIFLVPVTLFGGIFAYSHLKQHKDD
jgi:hypothetical protein